MANTIPKMSNLPTEVKSLVNDGVYSLYTLKGYDQPLAKYVLITDSRKFFVLNGDGDVIGRNEIANKHFSEPVKFSGLTEPRSKLNAKVG